MTALHGESGRDVSLPWRWHPSRHGGVRHRRTIWQRTHQHVTDQDSTLVINWLAYTGAGWKTAGDALLANTAAALARERQQAARDALAQLTRTRQPAAPRTPRLDT
jgi:hypothetical protein